jgi:hypothetical protein
VARPGPPKTWMAGPSPRRKGFGPAGGSSPTMTKVGLHVLNFPA